MHSPATLSVSEEQLVHGLQTISDPTRYKIFKLLLTSPELCVSNIASALGVSVSAVSQHFRLFEMAGLVDRQRYGQKICYRLKENNKLVAKLIILTENS